MKTKTFCWKCNKTMKKEKTFFHGFSVIGWKCPKCKEVIYEEEEIQPILEYHKLKTAEKELAVKVGVLGNTKILRIPKIAEEIYNINKGEQLAFNLEPGQIVIKIKE